MISYRRGGPCFWLKVFRMHGSVFPSSFCIAAPCGLATAALRYSIELGYVDYLGDGSENSVLKDNSCWSGFVFLVGFLIVFRTSQAYARFWEGCAAMFSMRAEWFDACSCLVAFCKNSKAESTKVMEFQHMLIRLFSMLHALALADIEDSNSDEISEIAAFKYELLDASGVDEQSLKAVKESDSKVELVFQWVQQLLVENIDNDVLSIPPPILSRAFQELANGMVAFHEAIKISTIPFPFPYAQTCECLLMIHWVVTPIVVAQWVSTPWWGCIFAFMQVFIYWTLNNIAVEIENPFGMDANDIDASIIQGEFNRHLMLLVEPTTLRTPRLATDVPVFISEADDEAFVRTSRRLSLVEIWKSMEVGPLSQDPIARSARRRPSSSWSSTPGASATMSKVNSANSNRTSRRLSHEEKVRRLSSFSEGGRNSVENCAHTIPEALRQQLTPQAIGRLQAMTAGRPPPMPESNGNYGIEGDAGKRMMMSMVAAEFEATAVAATIDSCAPGENAAGRIRSNWPLLHSGLGAAMRRVPEAPDEGSVENGVPDHRSRGSTAYPGDGSLAGVPRGASSPSGRSDIKGPPRLDAPRG